ncbi:MAG: hypothetical protein WEB57_01615 [Pseudohongiellaceae bacterium]
MYLRFVIEPLDGRSGRRKGIFAGMGILKRRDDLHPDDFKRYRALAEWFNENLDMPSRFSRSSKRSATPRALSWFRDSATEYIAKTRELAAIFDKYDISVTMLKTHRPGYIVYESENQIVAEPYSDTET